jgi:hypothetical protein
MTRPPERLNMPTRRDHDPDDTDRAYALIGPRKVFVRCGYYRHDEDPPRQCVRASGHYGLCDY